MAAWAPNAVWQPPPSADCSARSTETARAVLKRLDFEGNIENGKVNRNGELSFTIPRERDGTKFVIKYTGKVDGDSLRIKGVVTLNGQEHAREFEARRVAD